MTEPDSSVKRRGVGSREVPESRRPEPARNSFHRCTLLRAVTLSTRPHPCTVTATHHPHTRPPDTHAIAARLEYQGSLVSTYRTYDLRRIPARARLGSRSALALTRNGAGVDLPGLRRNSMPRSEMNRTTMPVTPALLPVAALSPSEPMLADKQ